MHENSWPAREKKSIKKKVKTLNQQKLVMKENHSGRFKNYTKTELRRIGTAASTPTPPCPSHVCCCSVCPCALLGVGCCTYNKAGRNNKDSIETDSVWNTQAQARADTHTCTARAIYNTNNLTQHTQEHRGQLKWLVELQGLGHNSLGLFLDGRLVDICLAFFLLLLRCHCRGCGCLLSTIDSLARHFLLLVPLLRTFFYTTRLPLGLGCGLIANGVLAGRRDHPAA